MALCPSLPLKVTIIAYKPTLEAQVVSLLTCLINSLSCPLAFVENILVLIAVLRKRELRSVHNTSILCLAVADCLVPVLIQPAFIAYQARKYDNGTLACVPYFLKTVFEMWSVGLSFITLSFITIERYVAIVWPFQYEEHFKKKLIIFTISSCWLVWTIFTFTLRFSPVSGSLKIFSGVAAVVLTSNLLLTSFVYYKVYKLVRNHQNAIRAQPSGATNLHLETKATATIFYITGAQILCCLPTVCVSVLHQANVFTDEIIMHEMYPLAESALFLSSVFNPAIYVWRNQRIRKSLKEFVKRSNSAS